MQMSLAGIFENLIALRCSQVPEKLSLVWSAEIFTYQLILLGNRVVTNRCFRRTCEFAQILSDSDILNNMDMQIAHQKAILQKEESCSEVSWDMGRLTETSEPYFIVSSFSEVTILTDDDGLFGRYVSGDLLLMFWNCVKRSESAISAVW
ncbi:hypothetical protein HAX54_001320 [Datura stramonium]|uniref:Uncharacterized protein n=1 Tax=Datura stramonium TaxID=4076 RepID=A0ABS8RSI9_DATST|nr:hypothetical protein [Datura stramonium]